jgi:hypothetical protein
LALAATAGFTTFGSEIFTALLSLLPPFAATGLFTNALTALVATFAADPEFFTDDTPEDLTVFWGSAFAFDATALTAGLTATLAVALAATLALITFLGAAALPAILLVATLAATFETGLDTPFGAGFTVELVAALVTVLLADLFELLVVVIFKADPNFRLAAFFSVALDFFAFEAARDFAGFFML